MKTGALIFAYDNEHTDYVQMAAWCAARVKQHLDIPVALVTNQPHRATSIFDHVIETDSGNVNRKMFEDHDWQMASWHNTRRTDAYALTPFDQTLVLDADFVINSDFLRHTFATAPDFLCYKDAFSVGQQNSEYLTDYNSFGQYHFPMWWATVMLFRKSTMSSYIFDTMHMVKQNWAHYLDLYNIKSSIYRNDFALSIALGLVSGHTLSVDQFVGALPTVLPSQRLQQLDTNMWQIEWQEDSRTKTVSIAGLDFHAMCKRDLGAIVAGH